MEILELKRLVCVDDLSHENWLKFRKKGIGGSDIASILGLNPYRSALALYFEKVTEEILPEEENIAAELGLELEPFLARKFEKWIKKTEDLDVVLEREPYILQHPQYEYMLVNLDRKFIHPIKGYTPVELKTTSEFNRSNWEEDELPDSYYIQVQWQLLITEAKQAYIAYLIGNRNFNVKEIQRNDEVIERLIIAAQNFWGNNVIPRIPPAPDGSVSSKEILKRMYPKEEDLKTIDLPELAEDYKLYKDYNEQLKLINPQIEAIKQKIMFLMGTAEIANIDGHKVTWKTISKVGYFVKPSSSRQLRIY
ncbi:MAG: YqaJ viral recombinase family nuclease [Candidatus Humimicrobiaceae bacterium]